MIEIKHLTKFFGSFKALDDLSLSVPRGQVVGLLGPNGAGKTTTLRIMTGYIPPSSGSISVSGFDSVTASNRIRRLIGYLPEANPLPAELRVAEYLHFRARLFGLTRAERKVAVDRAIARTRLAEMQRRLIGRLSKGYRQRVGLAAALLHDPQLLILDEPTSGLDPHQIRETRALIRELAGQHTMILSSHILPEIQRTCDRVVIVARGRIRADGTIEDLTRRSGRESHYVLEIKVPDRAPLQQALRQIKGIREVHLTELPDGWLRATLQADGSSDDPGEAIGRLLRQRDITFRELHREAQSLEQLFLRVTTDDDAAQAEIDANDIRRDSEAKRLSQA